MTLAWVRTASRSSSWSLSSTNSRAPARIERRISSGSLVAETTITTPPACATLWMRPKRLGASGRTATIAAPGIQVAVLVGDLLGGRPGADDVGDVLEREPQVRLLRVVHSKQQDSGPRHRCT